MDVPPSRQALAGAASRAATRERLLDAATEEFLARGYTEAAVARIAARAGVTVQTLYLAWGSKRELLRGFMQRALGVNASYAQDLQRRVEGVPPRETVAAIAGLFGEIASRSARGWALYREAGAVDPEIAADWSDLQSRRRGTVEMLLETVPDASLRKGLSRASAIDTAWAIASPESYDLLVTRLGYTATQFERWVDETLAVALLNQPS